MRLVILKNLPMVLVCLEALLLLLGGLSTILLDNHSGNWGGANGILLVLVALPGLLLLKATGLLSLSAEFDQCRKHLNDAVGDSHQLGLSLRRGLGRAGHLLI